MADRFTTYNTKLEYGSSTTTMTAVRVKTTPQIEGSTEALDATDLQNSGKVYLQGIKDTPTGFDFTANANSAVKTAIDALTAEQNIKITYGDGAAYTFKGYLSCYFNDSSVNAVQEMTIHVIPTTEPAFTAGTSAVSDD